MQINPPLEGRRDEHSRRTILGVISAEIEIYNGSRPHL